MNDCDRSEPLALKTVDEALQLMLAQARPVGQTESLPTLAAAQRVLAEAVASTVNVPPWDNSAMDGYAVSHADCKSNVQLKVSQRIPAGSHAEPLQPGTAARIFTGAPIPEGADTVIMQEHCRALSEAGSDWVMIEKPADMGSNIRRAGEDIRQGDSIITAGTRLRPQHLGLAASVGVPQLAVYRRLRVAIFSSGDELVMPGKPLEPGKIYNSNRFTLTGLLQSLDCEVIDLGMVEDTLDATCQALQQGAAQADLILASGGVSVGEEDHVKPAVERLGSLDLWKIAMRPGKPVAFGHVDGVPFIGAPGNPVSLFVTFCIFARPFIRKMQGIADPAAIASCRLPAAFDWTKPDTRQEYARARLGRDANGEYHVEVFPSRSSGVLSSVTWADGLVMIRPGEVIRRGDPVTYLSFSELLS